MINMDGLDGWRSKIDEIDKKIIELFEERMELVKNIGRYKEENNLPIFNEDRERKVIEKNILYIKNDSLKTYGEKLIQSIMDISKEYQCEEFFSAPKETQIKKIEENESLKVGYPGVEGSFSEEALLKYFGEECNRKNYEEFESVFEGLKNEEIDYGVLPIENSSTGAVNEVYDLIRKYGFYIVGEEYISIAQHLLVYSDAEIEDIREVHSHNQGLKQSSKFLKNYPEWKQIPNCNTAVSAKLIMESKDITKAAIASKRASEIYNLKILKEDINNEKSNKTRFIIIGRELEKSKDKISVIFTLENKVGSLFNVLKFINDYGLNMVKIESRPMGDEPWKYFFYLDFQGDLETSSVKTVLALIEKNSSYYKLLGAYESNC